MNYVVNVVLRRERSGLVVRTQPEHLDLNLGDRVIWQCQAVDAEPDVDFRILFREGAPFHTRELAAEVRDGEPGAAQSEPAEEPGEFKYDVQASRPSGAPLAEEDPYLHVSR